MHLLESDKFKLGLFVTISFLSICIVFIAFGFFDFVSEKVAMVTLFQESVQGLETGSLVKYRGVPIGKVTDITINTKNTLIRVDMEINLKKLREEPIGKSKPAPVSSQAFYNFMKHEIRNGLRASLEFNGISGFKYIELDYKAKGKKVDVPFAFTSDLGKNIFFIPSEPSMMSGLRSGITETIAKIASIDYKLLSEKVETVLTKAQELIADPNLKKMLKNSNNVTEELSTTVKNLNQVMTPEKLNSMAGQMEIAMRQIKMLAEKMDKTISDAKIEETTSSFRSAVSAFRDSERAFNNTMAKFNETMDAMTELIKTLDNNPSSLLHGKK